MMTSRIGSSKAQGSRCKVQGYFQPASFNRAHQGFTFIELVFVTLAICLLAFTAAPRLHQGWSRLQTERTAFALAQMLRTARTLAVADGQPVAWVWESGARRVWLGALQDDGSPAPLPDRLGQPQAIPEAVTLAILQDGEPVERVSFYPNGTSQPTTVQIGDAAAVRYQIVVDETTGQVAVQPAPPS